MGSVVRILLSQRARRSATEDTEVFEQDSQTKRGFAEAGKSGSAITLRVLCVLCGENCLKDPGYVARRASFEMRAVRYVRSSGSRSVRKVIAA